MKRLLSFAFILLAFASRGDVLQNVSGTTTTASGGLWVKQTFCGNTTSIGLTTAGRVGPVNGYTTSPLTNIVVDSIMPSTGYLSNFQAFKFTTPSSGTNVVFVLRTNAVGGGPVSSPLTVTINAGDTLIADTTHSVTCGSATCWSLMFTANATIASDPYGWSVEWWHQLP